MRQVLRFLSLILVLCLTDNTSHAQTLIQGATILTLAEQQNEAFDGYLLIDASGRIAALGAGEYNGDLPPNTQTLDASGQILIPGFVSGHNHLWQSAFRGIAPEGTLFPWLEALHWTYGDFFDQGDFYAFTLHGALDQLSRGITTTYNHSQRLGASEAHYMESLSAELDAGQHFIFAYNANVESSAGVMEAQFAQFMAQADAQAQRPTSPMLGASMNVVGNFAGEAVLQREMALVHQYGISAQLHYLEEYDRRELERAQWPMLLAQGAVAAGVSYAHFIQTTDEILSDTANRGGAMIWNPLSNGRLASGLADIPDYLARGIGVGMGVDGAASADIADPFENMRMGMYALRMQHRDPSVMMPLDILRLHTLDTARVLGVADQVGSLEVGKRADLLLIDPADPLTGPVFDPAAHLVFATNASNIQRIYVNGQLKVQQGALLDFDTQQLHADVAQRVARIVQLASPSTH